MKSLNNWAHYLKIYSPAFIWAGFIFLLSATSKLPGPPQPTLDFIFKQTAHIFVYAVLYFLLWRANKKSWLINLIIVFLYALSDEYHQSFVPGREATLVDIGFDSAGIIIAYYLTHRQKQIHSHTPLSSPSKK